MDFAPLVGNDQRLKGLERNKPNDSTARKLSGIKNQKQGYIRLLE
jgi:hypothetical protein